VENDTVADNTPNFATAYKAAVGQLKKELNISNPMMVPRLSKIVVNIGQGDAVQNVKILDAAIEDLRIITGQQPIKRKARTSIAGFKLRQGQPIGCSVTLRREMMYEFLERLINNAIPRIRDFRGFSPKAFDGRGNYSLGIKEQIVFPEIDYDKVDKIRGIGITLVTTAKNDVEAKALLDIFKFPFRK
jgi:large subunit ribosomal protein L5